MMNLKGTTILLVWKVLLNQSVHMHCETAYEISCATVSDGLLCITPTMV